MKYEAKIIPEGINTSDENPLKELLLLIGGAFAVIALLIVLLAYLSDFLIGFISPEMESNWFSPQLFELRQFETHQKKTGKLTVNQFEEAEFYLAHLINQLKAKEKQGFKFTVSVYDDDLPNAFILPGGHIFISVALFDAVDSENGLAMVLAHEMAHQYERHPIRSLGRGVLVSVALTAILGNDASEWLGNFFFETATIGRLAFSREQERDADRIAVENLIAYYGHALGADEFFRHINKNKGLSSSLPEFYQSHPGTEERIQFLNQKTAGEKGQTTILPKLITELLQ
jgi:Zn-dependent protease with chaperone function